MFSTEEMMYYDRQIRLDSIGLIGQEKLKKAKVLVVGAGGLGCPVLQYLAAAGVGKIGIVDFDKISQSNLHRQLLYSYDSIGKEKVEVAALKLNQINPFIEICKYPVQLNDNNVLEIFSHFDIIVDCTDNFETRYLINDACVLIDKPFVFAAIYKSEGQLSVFNYLNGPTYRCLFNEVEHLPDIDCNQLGVLGVLPGFFGVLQANEVIKIILQKEGVLSGKVLYFNLLNNESRVFSLTRKQTNYKQNLVQNGLSRTNYKQCQSALYKTKSIVDLFSIEFQVKPQFLDVRNDFEHPQFVHPLLHHIPINELEERTKELDNQRPIIVFCQSGKRSIKACQLLIENQFDLVYNIESGVSVEMDDLMNKYL